MRGKYRGVASNWISWGAFCLIITTSGALRLRHLERPAMWVDEAESSLNALSILQHGVPRGEYLGKPMFENTLIRPNPASLEYEFQDSSYNRDGLAMYHSWLPLFSIASSFKVFGIAPDTDVHNLRPKYSTADINRRIRAARVPGVIFGVAMVAMLFLTGRKMHSPAAGWIAMTLGAIAPPMVSIARQARYYSLLALLSVVCVYAAWQVVNRGRWRDYLLAAVAFVLLFHSHALTFTAACAASLVLLPSVLHQPRAWPKLLTTALIVLVGVVPFVLWTQMLQTREMPPAWKFLQLSDVGYAMLRLWPIALLVGAGFVWSVLSQRPPRWLPATLRLERASDLLAIKYLVFWIVVIFATFMTIIPVPSMFIQRLYLGGVGPILLLVAVMLATASRSISPRWVGPIGGSLAIALLLGSWASGYIFAREPFSETKFAELIADMKHWTLAPDTRLYFSPNDQLIFMFYTGVPGQSIAPIRKSYLNDCPDPIVYIDTSPRIAPVSPAMIRAAAGDQTAELAQQVNQAAVAQTLAGKVASITPQVDLPLFAQRLVDETPERTRQRARQSNPLQTNPVLYRGFNYDDPAFTGVVYNYRFVDPIARSGENANYTRLLRRSDARILPNLWVVFSAPPAK